MLRRIVFLTLLAAAAVACKQGEGEPCQVNSDCESGLVCRAQAPHTCEKDTGNVEPEDAGPPDATPIDAEPVDASPIDATPPDAPPA